MNKKMKFWMAAGLITVLTGTSTAALASDKVPNFIKKTATTTQDGTTTQKQTDGTGKNHVRGEFGVKIGGPGFGIKFGNDELLTLLKLTKEQFQTQIEAGKTLVEIGKAQNVTEQQLVDFMTKQNATQIDQAVKDGKLTQEQAVKIKADFPTHIKEMINNTPPAKGEFGGRGGHGAPMMVHFNDELFKLLNLTQADFQKQLESGKTLVEIGKAQNVTEQQLIDFMTKQNTAHLDQEVKDGKLTQEQADKMKADFPTHIKEMINNTMPAKGEFGGHGGPGFGLKFGDELFTLLNITKEQFQTELQSGKTLLEIATAHNVTEQQLTDFLVKQETAHIDQAVTDGKMTQEQATQFKSGLAEKVKNMISSKPGDHFAGKGFGGKEKGQFFNKRQGTAPSTTAPATKAPTTQAQPQSYKL